MLAHLLLEPGKISYEEVETPVPGPGEVVVRVSTALTCGTDLKAFLRGHPKMPMPTLFGHEFAGDVAFAGRGVRDFREGDAVMAVPTAPCKTCYYCRHEQENLCTTIMDNMVLGAYAEYVKLPAAVVETNMFPKAALARVRRGRAARAAVVRRPRDRPSARAPRRHGADHRCRRDQPAAPAWC